jgi:ribosomal protein S18 acetylase RimI-like enzyme
MHFEVRDPELNLGKQCEDVLRSLPEWFGIESALVAYAEKIQELPTYTASACNRVIGFLSIKQHFPQSAEIYVMGVMPEFHYMGVGRALLERAWADLGKKAVKFLQVKTLSPSKPDEAYRKTRHFYLSAGFLPLEEMQDLWGAGNPCLVMIKNLEANGE